jgi:exonuclease III
MVTTANLNGLDVSRSNCDLTQVANSKFKQTRRNSLNIFHQNIRGLQRKIDVLTCMLLSHDLSLHIICTTEHYLVEQKLSMIKPENDYLASNFSRQFNIGGGVCIYCKSDLDCNAVDITKYGIEKVIEACAAQMKIGNNIIILLCVYRSPSGNFQEFNKQLEIILKCLYKPKSEIILCGDFNVNFLDNSSNVHQVVSLLQTYNLFRAVDFPTRITKESSTAIDNIFLDYNRSNTFHVFSVIMIRS